ncbi:MAG: general secretion pathway protein GspK [Myxococcales bacterium]|nr:general secretion pathway protein GspK [Myxococcales bacterium]
MKADTPLARVKSRMAVARRKRRGVALLMVLGSLAVLTVLVVELQEQSSSTLSAALAERDALKAEYHARSGVNLSRMLIATEQPIRQTFAPLWAAMGQKGAPPQIPVWKFTSLVLGPFNCPESQAEFARVTQASPDSGKNLGSTEGCFDIRIIDEDAKINVNSGSRGDPFSQRQVGAAVLGLLSSPQYAPLFENADSDGQYSNQPTICGALVDWTDEDENAYPCDPLADAASASQGPEDNYYQTVGLPYLRKNAPFDSMDEVRLVRGISDDFWATFVDPNPADPDSRVLTVWGQGKVNVNTANAQTLLALACAGAPEAPLCIDPEQMSLFLMAVTLAREVTQGMPVFKSPRGFVRALQGKGKGIGALFAALGLEPITFKDPKLVEKAVQTESRVFSIYVDGVVPGRHRETRVRLHDVVDFRSANELGASAAEDTEETKNKNPDATASAAPSNEPLTPEQIAAALASDPLGVIIYHRIE